MNHIGQEYDQDCVIEIQDLLIGRKVKAVDGYRLILDNGLELEIIPNLGCSGCGSGNYDITELNGCDNVITNVELAEDTEYDDEYKEYFTSYKIFVFTEDKRIKLLQVDGSDGNGWYGTGYEIHVKVGGNYDGRS